VIDLRRLREEPEYRAGIERKRVAPGVIDDVLALDAQRRELQHQVEELRHEQNAASKAIGKAAPDERPDKIAAAGALKEQLTKEDFASGVESLKLDPSCTTAYDDLKVSSESGTNIADVTGVIKCEGKDIELVYRFTGKDELKMVNIRLKPKG